MKNTDHWPARSLDLDPFGSLWGLRARRVRSSDKNFHTINALKQAVNME